MTYITINKNNKIYTLNNKKQQKFFELNEILIQSTVQAVADCFLQVCRKPS